MRELDRLQDLCDIRTKRDLVNNALTLFQWVVEELQQGRTIASLSEAKGDPMKELLMPFFAEVAAKRQDSLLLSELEEASIQRDRLVG